MIFQLVCSCNMRTQSHRRGVAIIYERLSRASQSECKIIGIYKRQRRRRYENNGIASKNNKPLLVPVQGRETPFMSYSNLVSFFFQHIILYSCGISVFFTRIFNKIENIRVEIQYNIRNALYSRILLSRILFGLYNRRRRIHCQNFFFFSLSITFFCRTRCLLLLLFVRSFDIEINSF